MIMKTQENLPLKNALRQARASIPLLFTVTFFINMLMLTAPLYMMQTFDRVLASGRVETLLFLTLIAGVAVLVMGLLEMARGRALGRIGRWLERKLAPELIQTSVRGALQGLPANAQALRDLTTVRTFFSGIGVNAFLDAPWFPIFLAIMWIMHPWFGLIGLGATIVLVSLAVLNEYLSRRTIKKAQHLSIANMQKAEAAIRNADVIQSMGLLPGFLTSWIIQHDEAETLNLRASDQSAALIGLSRFVRLFVQILVLGTGAYLVLSGALTAGGMIAASILLGRTLAPAEQAIGAWKGFVAARGAWERLHRLCERLPVPSTPMALPPPEGRLTCEQIYFRQPGQDRFVLNGVDFALEAGQALGIVGESAAGKSTLCKILVGSWRPTRGHARLDGADLTAWPPEQRGPFIGYLPQDIELFAGTLADNIARLSPVPDAAAVVEAATIAGVHEMILAMPKGYETEIGEGGAALSGGQRQRIGLARALYGKPKLIVLDEPNASLDSIGERALIAAIQCAKGWGATIVVVAHQPPALAVMDKLLLLRNGQVALFGPRDEVFASLRARAVAQQQEQAEAASQERGQAMAARNN